MAKTESRRKLLTDLGALVAGAGVLGLKSEAIASSALRGLVDEVQRDRTERGKHVGGYTKDGEHTEYDKGTTDKDFTYNKYHTNHTETEDYTQLVKEHYVKHSEGDEDDYTKHTETSYIEHDKEP